MGPLLTQGYFNPEWSNVIAVLIGIAFGWVLESSGFSSTRKLAGVFYGYDFVVLKVFFTAATTAAIGLLLFEHLGWIDGSLLYINPAFLYPTLVGGFIMGLGFIMGGYCPGTSFCGAAIGKIDAIVFIGGMGLGVLAFSEAFPLFEDFYYQSDMGPVKVTEVLGMSDKLFVLVLTLVALAAFYVTGRIEARISKEDIQ